MNNSPIRNPFTGSNKNRRNLLTKPKPRKKKDDENETIEVDNTSFYTGLAVLVGIMLFAGQVFMTKTSSSRPILDTRIEASPEELLLQTPATHAWWTPTYFVSWMRRHSSSSSSSRQSETEKIPYWKAGYASQEEMDDRLVRFPGIEERVKIYMSNWYAPPCPDTNSGTVHFNYEIDKDNHLTKTYIQELPSPFASRPRLFQVYDQLATETSTLFYLQRKALKHHEKCSTTPACQDVLYQMLPIVQRSQHPETPTLLDLGDKALTFAPDIVTTTTTTRTTTTQLSEQLLENPQVPYFKRFRMALTKAEVDEMTVVSCVKGRRGLPESTGFPHLQPVLWKLKVLRHYGLIHNVTEFDIPYAEKKDMAVFRGRLSGIHKEGFLDRANFHVTNGKNAAYNTCMSIPRCRLVLKNAQSSRIDARLVGPQKGLPRAVQHVESGHSLDLFANEKMSVEEMLQYKAIIMFEGNDVAAGLKWALFSNSVVMMDPVTITSWAMEERLVPWVHYVPLHPDGSDVEERFQWVLNNPVAAERIAHRGSLWIKDMLFHPDAIHDEEQIYDEMMRRYQAHFEHDPMLF